jgi:nitrate reductase delta subunit
VSDHERLASLLAYPDRGRAGLRPVLDALDDELAADLAPFRDAVEALDDRALEELYTRTFDLNPVCSLEVGWHLFGEDYTRGNFLVGVRELLRRFGVAEGAELPDHLVHLLPALARMDGADDFARKYVLPALGKMLEGFEEPENPYRCLVAGVERELRRRHGEPVDLLVARDRQPYRNGREGDG